MVSPEATEASGAHPARRFVIRLAVAVICAALTFLVVSRFMVSRTRTRVAVVGDSLTAQSTWAIIDELTAHGYNATVAGENGATIDDQHRQLESLTLPGSTDVVVAALGTNNAFFASVTDGRHREMSTSRNDVRVATERLFEGQGGQQWKPSTRCVVWVNVNDRSPLLDLDKNAPLLNETMEETAAAQRDKGRSVVVADWAGTSREHPEWFLQDQVHLTTEGERAYAELIRRSVDRCQG